MKQPSVAHEVLKLWGFDVQPLTPADRERRKQADFLATRAGVRLLIEEKTKEEDPAKAAAREAAHSTGKLYAETLPLVRDETVSGVIRGTTRQLLASSLLEHDFRLIWFTATGPTAKGKYEQFMATLYGRTNIIEFGVEGYRRCYFFRNGDFFRRRDVVDGAVAAYIDGDQLHARLCLNSLSTRYAALRVSDAVLAAFEGKCEDPIAMEADGAALILDADIDRKDESALLEFLRQKYTTGPLMKIDLGYTRASVRV
jgi:hypothetical protein